MKSSTWFVQMKIYFFYLSIHPSARPSVRPPVRPPARPSVSVRPRLSVYPSVRPSARPPVRPCLPVYPPTRSPVRPPARSPVRVCLSARLSVRPSVRPSGFITTVSVFRKPNSIPFCFSIDLVPSSLLPWLLVLPLSTFFLGVLFFFFLSVSIPLLILVFSPPASF